MKIVQINAVYQYSSTGKITTEIHHFLQEQGHNSYVFCTNINNPRDQIFKIGNKLGYKLHALKSRITGLEITGSSFATKKLIKHLGGIEPDLVLLGNLHANYINLPILLNFLSKKNIPTVVVLHDCWFFTGQCCYYTEHECEQWKKECNNCPHIAKYHNSWFFDRSRYNYLLKRDLFGAIKELGVIGVSEWITEEARRSPVFKHAKIIRRIYNWINLSEFYPKDTESLRSELAISQNDFVVLGVSQGWSDVKGLNHMINIAQKNPDLKVILVGRMDVKAPELPNLLCVGETENVSQLADYYSLADVFLNCSIQETFGKVTAEALACGTPVIVNNATANPEFVSDGKCGYSVNNNNYDEIIAALSMLKSRGKAAYSDDCLAKAHRDFSMELKLKEYLDLFECMLS